MKVLFIPYQGGIPHIHPLIALAKKLSCSGHDTAFLLAADFHHLVKNLGFNVLDIDNDLQKGGVRTEMDAYRVYRPDVVVDDTSMTTLFVSAITKTPRIAVQRTGMFPGEIPKHPTLKHSLGKDFNPGDFENYRNFNLTVPGKFSDLFSAEIKVIPGIEEIEALPVSLKNDRTYKYAGPLIIDDFLYENETGGKECIVQRRFPGVEKFFERNKNRLSVYFTFGNMAKAGHNIRAAIRFLLDSGAAVISNIDIGEIKKEWQELYFFRRYLPMHFICSRVDLIIHHCGSGTYQYPILHCLPMMTIATDCRGRVDVALRLQEIGAAVHIPGSDECEDVLSLFKENFHKLADTAGLLYRSIKNKLVLLKNKSESAMASFNFEKVLKMAVEKKKG